MDQQAINDFGVIANERVGQEAKELNTEEAIIPLRVPDAIFDKFVKAAQFNKHPNVEAWAVSTLIQTLTSKIGAATIDSPGYLNNHEAKKITGPSNSGLYLVRLFINICNQQEKMFLSFQ